MQILVCSQNKKEVTGHAGKCRKFWAYGIENNMVTSKELIELPLEHSLHAIGQKNPGTTFVHPAFVADVLISGGMGTGLVNRLKKAHTKGLITTEKDPDKAVKNYLDGTLITIETISHGGHLHGL
jgi:predicted Fe-Mo cluster-binding NifX family protein